MQARLEAVLEAPVAVARACAQQNAVRTRMNAYEISQNEVARRAGVSRSHLSEIMERKVSPSANVLQRLHGVPYRRSPQVDRGMAANVQVLVLRKCARSGMVVRGAGAQGVDGVMRVGGRMRWGRRGGVRLSHGVQRPWAAEGDACGAAGLHCHVEAAGDGECVASFWRAGRFDKQHGRAPVGAGLDPECCRANVYSRWTPPHGHGVCASHKGSYCKDSDLGPTGVHDTSPPHIERVTISRYVTGP